VRKQDDCPLPAPRPAYAALGSKRGMLLPPLDDALERYLLARRKAAEEHLGGYAAQYGNQ
jgi:dTDP-4-dehydrorhamnose reductase